VISAGKPSYRISAYYDSDPDRETRRLEQHQLEYDLTWRYLEKYLPSQGSILEVGAATGNYTLPLAKRGYTVTAVDMSAALLEECRRRLAAEGLEKQVRLLVADARDLGDVAENGFDAVLLMGPLYHLVEEADRKMALKAAFERLRSGGFIFSAFISRYGSKASLQSHCESVPISLFSLLTDQPFGHENVRLSQAIGIRNHTNNGEAELLVKLKRMAAQILDAGQFIQYIRIKIAIAKRRHIVFVICSQE
jgi:SAM-dependent methyltransferase